jgi:hypothetical protein
MAKKQAIERRGMVRGKRLTIRLPSLFRDNPGGRY